MFTGLIEDVGTVVSVQQSASGSQITIRSAMMTDGIRLGDSIAIDGVCTTVVAFENDTFTIEASPETLRKTTFTRLKPGVRVNLERPLTPSSRIGGHYVTGHVDGLATLVSKTPEGISHIFTFELSSDELAQYLIPKGSVAVAGISLTVNQVTGHRFWVAIIPHTLAHTNLDQLKPGDPVNIETDILGKYVKKFLSPALHAMSPAGGVDEAFLAQHGFIPTPS